MGVEVLMSDYQKFSNWFSYDPETGDLRWNKTRGSAKAGHLVNCVNSEGYLVVALDGKQYRSHRIGWLLHYGEWPVSDLDHIDLDKTNNRIANLRECNDAQNQWNTKREAGKSRYKGVDWHTKTGRWRARIRIGSGQRIELGYFATEELAADAYAAAAVKYHGEFQRI